MAPVSQIFSLRVHISSLSTREVEVGWQGHEAGRFTCVAGILMARGDIVWAMPPNPQHAHCLAREYLLHLALWLRCGIPGLEENSGL
eukprot:489319-Amphidinium_carterae.1